MLSGRRLQFTGSLATDNAQRQGIVENAGLVVNLVCGTADGYTIRGSAEFAVLHVLGLLALDQNF
jgi:hypothetical protein